ncbi:MAG: hypothetical protein J3R72DRAFT_430580 [Linnemannia gamsii]|nr:MAG: hypothetical protein J3R72DRAFT_430580 [Linnemannia gamsii]
MMHPPPSIGQREDHYRHSPTLVASQTLAATYTGRPESPFQPYLPYQPYSNQQQLPSPTIADAYRSSGSMSSPGLGPYLSHYGVHEERSEYKADPYRSAYSQSVSNNNNSGAAAATAAASHHSPYLGSSKGSPNMHDDFSSSFESRLSGLSSQPNSSNSLRYPMRDLAGQDSNQALSASYYEQGRKQHQQHQHQPKKAIGTGSSSENGAVQSDPDLSTAVASPSGHHTRQSTNQHPSQPSKTDSSGTKKAKTVEDEDEEILQKLGVLSAGSSASRSGGTRSGLTQASGRSRRKGQWTSDSEEEGRAKAGAKRRRGGGSARQRRDSEGRCCCCTTRVCMIITLSILVCLGLTLFFAIPRTPVFTFESVTSNGPVNATKDGIEELFHIHLQVDSTANYLPIRLNRLDLTVRLQSESAKIADNVNMSSSFIIQPRAAKVVAIPMKLQYRASKKGNGPDMILDDLIEACKQTPQSPRAGLPNPHGSQPLGFDITVDGKLNVWGLSWVWKPEFTFSVEDVPCPINAANQPMGGGNLPPSPSSGVVTVPPATVFVAGITADAPTATMDPSLPVTTHANVVTGKTTSAASLSSPPTF